MTAKKLDIPLRPETDRWVHQKDKRSTTEKMKRLTLDIPEELHRAIKIQAAEEGVTIAQQLRELLEKHYS